MSVGELVLTFVHDKGKIIHMCPLILLVELFWQFVFPNVLA
jgi:hypothetical protein